MKKIICLTFVALFSTATMADEFGSTISCETPTFESYNMYEFLPEGAATAKETFIGLVDYQGVLHTFFPMTTKIFDCPSQDLSKQAVVGGDNGLGELSSWHKTIKKDYRYSAFKCFCDLNKNLLDGCYINEYTSTGNTFAAICKKGEVVFYIGDYNRRNTMPCFVAGTKISTPTGDKNIENIKAGDEVYSYDHKDNKVKVAKVTKPYIRKNKQYGELVLSNGIKLNATPEHRFYVVNKKKYIAVSKLTPNDKVYLYTGDKMEELTVVSYTLTGKADVYNFNVKDFHNYFAGKVLVHNMY